MSLSVPKADPLSDAAAPISASYRSARIFCALAIFVALLGSTTPSALYPLYVESWSIGQGTVTAIFAAYTAGALISLRLGGYLGTRLHQPRRLLAPAVTISGIGALTMAFAPSIAFLFAGRFLAGLATGAITGIATAAIYDLQSDGRRDHATAIATISFTAGAAIGPIVSSISIALGFAPEIIAYLPIAALSIAAVAGLSLSRWPEREARSSLRRPSRTDRRGVASAPGSFLVCVTVLSVTWMIGSTLMAVGSATFLLAFHLHSVSTAGLLPAVFQLFGGAGQYLFSRMAHRRAMIVGSIGLVFSQIGLAAAIILDWVVLFAVSVPLSGLFYGAAFVGSVGFANHTGAPHQRTARMSNLYLIGYFLSSVPAVILGFLADRVGISNAFLLFSFAAILPALAGAVMASRTD
jgi:MFS family permease